MAVATDLHSHALDVTFGILIILTLLGSGSVWLEGADRTQAIAALDGAAPSWMGRFSSMGTPVTVNILSGLIASAFVCFAFLVTHGSLANFFAVMIALVISTTSVSWGVSRVFFESVTLGAFAVMVALGVVFWAVGSLDRRRGLTGETELVSESAAPGAD